VKQQLAAVRMLFEWLITGQIVPMNPAAAVRGPKHVVKTGKTPVLAGDEWRKLLTSIPTTTLRDLRDRTLIATLTYSFARIGAALKMKVETFSRLPRSTSPSLSPPQDRPFRERGPKVRSRAGCAGRQSEFCPPSSEVDRGTGSQIANSVDSFRTYIGLSKRNFLMPSVK
jgi:hypothetical protein